MARLGLNRSWKQREEKGKWKKSIPDSCFGNAIHDRSCTAQGTINEGYEPRGAYGLEANQALQARNSTPRKRFPTGCNLCLTLISHGGREKARVGLASQSPRYIYLGQHRVHKRRRCGVIKSSRPHTDSMEPSTAGLCRRRRRRSRVVAVAVVVGRNRCGART